MRRQLAFLALALLALFAANASYGDRTVLAPDTDLFDTPEEAASAGLAHIATKPLGNVYEYGGQIVQTAEGKFAALTPRTDFSGDRVNIPDDAGMLGGLMGFTVVGSYHTHPCLHHHFTAYLSPDDMYEAIYSHRITFMGDMCTGFAHEFKPGDKPDVEQVEDDLWLSKGRILGQFTKPHQVQPE
jgi:hypothetical protein